MNFNKIDALVVEKSCLPTSKIQFREKRVQNERRPIGIRTGGDFKSLSLLESYFDRLKTLGKYSWHVVRLYTKSIKKKDFSKFENPCNRLRLRLTSWDVHNVFSLRRKKGIDALQRSEHWYALKEFSDFFLLAWHPPMECTYKLMHLFICVERRLS